MMKNFNKNIRIIIFALILFSCFSSIALADNNTTSNETVVSLGLSNDSNPVLMYIMNIPLAFMILYLVSFGLCLMYHKWIFHLVFIMITLMMIIDLRPGNSGFGDIFVLFILLVIGFLRLYTDFTSKELE